MTLRAHIMARIAADGPLSVADYMADCLLHPAFGYYATRDPFGVSGDFTTAPEISQMFGELLGLSLAQSWLDQGRPDPFTLAELGPGRGTLMADALRATARISGFHDAAQITLVEASATLHDIQKITLKGTQINWVSTVNDLPDQPLYLIANEFFDALPIRQFQRAIDGWSERRIGVQGDTLAFGLTEPAAHKALDHRLDDTKPGDLVEICPTATAIIHTIGTRINQHGGAALILDYGDWRSLGDTFQAVRTHTATDPLENPGNADLTAHVDFEALAAAAPCRYTRLTPQGVFLERLGITARAGTLAKGLSGKSLESLIAAHRRLTHPDEMGNLFKALGLYPDTAKPPPGLEP